MLLALLAAVVPLGWAVAVSCVLFGLWHVVPTAALLDVNCIARDRALIVAASVAAAAAAGLLLCWLRLTTFSVAAPAAVHASVTGTATIAAYVVQRRTNSPSPSASDTPEPLRNRRRSERPARLPRADHQRQSSRAAPPCRPAPPPSPVRRPVPRRDSPPSPLCCQSKAEAPLQERR